LHGGAFVVAVSMVAANPGNRRVQWRRRGSAIVRAATMLGRGRPVNNNSDRLIYQLTPGANFAFMESRRREFDLQKKSASTDR
jgi:hypothetical protein